MITFTCGDLFKCRYLSQLIDWIAVFFCPDAGDRINVFKCEHRIYALCVCIGEGSYACACAFHPPGTLTTS